MTKTLKKFQVYFLDELGAERKATQVIAKSAGQALSLARQQGHQNVTAAVEVK